MRAPRPRRLVIAAATLSLLAAAVHVWVMPEHVREWWGYGAFFLVVAIAQALYPCILLRGVPSSGLIWVGVLGNLAIIGLWAWTRTAGIPLFGPHAGEVETIGAIDVAAKIVEALLIACLVMLLRGKPTS
jgi:energy-coupling factor transporter transmembrane protein EcfT